MAQGREYLDSDTKRNFDLAIAKALYPIYLWQLRKVQEINSQRGQPVFVYLKRCGKDGKEFDEIKFETMFAGAENDCRQYLQYDAGAGRENTDSRVDSRYRRTRENGWNELPQIKNVINGEMSMVGSRPLPGQYREKAKTMFPECFGEWEDTIIKALPGVFGVNPEKTRDLAIRKFPIHAAWDVKYIYEADLKWDVKVCLQALLIGLGIRK